MSKNPQPGESVNEYVARRMADRQGNKHLKKLVASHLLANEEVLNWAPAYREGTTFEGVAALSDRRIMFYRSGSFGDKLEPIPIDKISSVESKRGMMFLDATIYTSGDSLKLRFAEKPRGDELLLALQEVMHRSTGEVSTSQPEQASSASQSDDPMALIAKLGELRTAGLLTDEEFASKKAELLGRI